MPETSFRMRRRRSRAARIARLLAALALLVAVAGLLARLVGGGEPKPEPLARVAFTNSVRPVAQGPAQPDAGAAEREAGEIARLLDTWYQAAFVDPKGADEGTYPSLQSLVTPEARAAFARDVNALTIGEARGEVRSVRPTLASAAVTVYFDRDAHPEFAVAVVEFRATAAMREKKAHPLRIEQAATFHLRKEGGRWVIFAYGADETQKSATPSPSPSP